ncbi:hypothetical protein [Paenibacillus rhizophilus]|uniref:hypothetical protein n=1 Tax=Paenibacillus rhizophilus TaxID=1850366 RepID=UPI001639B9DC|nr:hypothetical protein [Paenibacillus rhizophilus]
MNTKKLWEIDETQHYEFGAGSWIRNQEKQSFNYYWKDKAKGSKEKDEPIIR